MARRRRLTRLGTSAAAAAVLVLLAVERASAEDSTWSNVYVGAGLAVTEFESDHEGIGFGATPFALQVYGGLQLREGAAVELALDHLDAIDSGVLLGSGVDRLRISAEHSSVTLRGVFSLSLEEVLRRRRRISVFATIGAARTLEKRSVLELATARQTSVAERDTALVVGVGAMLDLERVRVRTYMQSADRRDGTLDSVGAAAEFRF